MMNYQFTTNDCWIGSWSEGRAMNLTDPDIDDQIRAALRDADSKGKLGVAAAVIGISGGAAELRKIMSSTGELNVLDRGMIGLHLGLMR